MRIFTKEELAQVIRLHNLWICNRTDGVRANLSVANLRGADLSVANLSGANLREADLSVANLRGADLSGANLPNFQLCPEEGSFIGWKKVKGNIILKLEIIGDRTSSLIGRKCRCSKAKVIAAYDIAMNPVNQVEFFSGYNRKFKYKLGEVVEEPDYDSNIRVECTKGIHFFMTKKEAQEYSL